MQIFTCQDPNGNVTKNLFLSGCVMLSILFIVFCTCDLHMACTLSADSFFTEHPIMLGLLIYSLEV